MGTGDIILAAALGANLGITGLALALWLCFVLGGGVATLCVTFGFRDRKEPMPYGPCLAVGGGIALFGTPAFGEWLLRTLSIAMPL